VIPEVKNFSPDMRSIRGLKFLQQTSICSRSVKFCPKALT